MPNIDDYLRHELEGLNAKEVAELIRTEFKHGSTTFKYCLTDRESCAHTIESQTGSGTIGAEEISPIEFWGGPPNKRQFYRGSLLTYLCDLVLHNWVTTGNYNDLVGNYSGQF